VTTVIYILFAWFGFVFGFLVRTFLSTRLTEYSGTIFVKKDEVQEKTIYSLELEEHPENLSSKKIVVFRVDTSEENLDRN